MIKKTDKKIQQKRTAILAILVTVGSLAGVISMIPLVQAATPCISFQSDPPISYGVCAPTDRTSASVLSMSGPLNVWQDKNEFTILKLKTANLKIHFYPILSGVITKIWIWTKLSNKLASWMSWWWKRMRLIMGKMTWYKWHKYWYWHHACSFWEHRSLMRGAIFI